MRTLFFIFFASVFLTLYGEAQELTWHTDIEQALDIASDEDKKMLLFFTGSDWCGWCTKLQNEVFRTADFEAWSEDMVLVELDFPRRTPQDEKIRGQNQQLQSMFKVKGYPTVYFVAPEKMPNGRTHLKSLGSTGYVRGGAKKWLDVANNIVEKEI